MSHGKIIGAYKTVTGWSGWDKEGRTWPISGAEAKEAEDARVQRLNEARKPFTPVRFEDVA